MYIYIIIHIHIYIYIYIFIYIYYICICTFIYINTYVYNMLYIYVCMYKYMYTFNQKKMLQMTCQEAPKAHTTLESSGYKQVQAMFGCFQLATYIPIHWLINIFPIKQYHMHIHSWGFHQWGYPEMIGL